MSESNISLQDYALLERLYCCCYLFLLTMNTGSEHNLRARYVVTTNNLYLAHLCDLCLNKNTQKWKFFQNKLNFMNEHKYKDENKQQVDRFYVRNI